MDTLFNLLFRCPHKKTTFPMTSGKAAGASRRETYVVCLDCGKRFFYDWEQMRVGREADFTASPAEPERAAAAGPQAAGAFEGR